MKLINTLAEMQALKHPEGLKIGFVPTMGYLHEGHLSLVDASKKDCDLTIVSIFVNPAQFGENEDLDSYPRDMERDLSLLKARGVDYVFFPDARMMYPNGYRTWVEVEGLSDILCGASRKGHFRGVCTVVLKLVNIVKPHYMYMGDKDYQQQSILRIMLKDLNLETTIVGCPIVREQDGLAKSSRNVYLDPNNRQIALCLYRALIQAQQEVRSGILVAETLAEHAAALIESTGARVDYVKIIDSRDLSFPNEVNEHSRMVIAAYVGKTRLIDNMLLVSP